MSSWNSSFKQNSSKGFLYQTTEAGFCSLFNTLFYDWLFCQSKKQTLFCRQTPNPIGQQFPLFQSLLPPRPYLQYVSESNGLLQPIPKQERIYFLLSQPPSFLREKAREFFQWTCPLPPLQFPSPRIGVHIRAGDKITTGEMKKIDIDVYVQKVQSLASPSDTIFLMSDTFSCIEEFKQKASLLGHTWNIVHFPQGKLQEHIQSKFNEQSESNKKEALFQFLSELEIMKACPVIVCTLSSNVGRWLYCNANSIDKFHSLDVQVFSPV